jgi:indole-3-glycerol phosphate synthase
MSSLLEEILEATRERVRDEKRHRSFNDLDRDAAMKGSTRGFVEAIRSEGMCVIAEFKRASPSKGPIDPDADPARIAEQYQIGGARALSVLTEPYFFSGSLADLSRARGACELPVLRKDFLIDPYQVAQARVAGADAILLIVDAFTDRGLFREMAVMAAEYRLPALVEIHHPSELDLAFEAEPALIGVNQRNLRTFEVDGGLAIRLRGMIPAEVALVAESGISDRAQVQALEEAGVDAVLVGESLMRSPDPAAAISELLGRSVN